MVSYKPDKTIIAKNIATLFKSGDVVNLGIGLPTLVGDYIPKRVDIILHSENGFLGLGPTPAPEKVDMDIVNAGNMPVSILPGGMFFDSAASFGIIRGGHLDYTVLGVLEVDQHGNLANYKIPGKMIPGMGGAMDLVVGAKKVIAATLHFDKAGTCKLKQRCSLPLTAEAQVDFVVTDVGFFEINSGTFILKKVFSPYTAEFVFEHTDADILIAEDFQLIEA